MIHTGKRYRIGADNPHFRGGRTHDSNGYVLLSSAIWGTDRGRREHQVVAEQMLGRPLRTDEVVHHRNGEKADNRPENLRVVTRREHQRIHLGKGRAAPRPLRTSPRLTGGAEA